MIQNGDFSKGLKNWEGLYFYSPTTNAATTSVVDSVFVVNITKPKQKFTWTVKMAQSSDPNCRFGFGFGQFTGNVYIDNVSIEKVIATQATTLSEPMAYDFDVFPNPSSGILEITSHSTSELPTTLNLYNLQGQLITTLWKGEVLYSNQTIRINLKENKVAPGIYFLTFSSPERKITRKVVVT